VLKPARYGGYELGLYEHGIISLELSKGCGSTGWIYSLLDEASWFIALFPPEAQDEVWGADPTACAAGSLRPNATRSHAERVDGGFRLSGRFSFASGSDHATWIFLAAFAPPTGEGEAIPYFFLVPKTELELVDDWFVMGMRGTAPLRGPMSWAPICRAPS
jgi:3-hydroxy-9,10-secoandrosta-1,3,5(10)-triene-9,17-dione monooxygenase